MLSNKITQFAALVLPLVTSACAYRFTNEHIVRPEGIQSIAVEAVYDTSREVMPHELLWQSLQDAFAADGHLRLASQKQADALLRAHLRDASLVPSGSEKTLGPLRDPVVEDPRDPTSLPALGAFRPLTRAGEIRDSATLSFVVDVEVWSLRTRTMLLKRTYPLATSFLALHPTLAPNDFLRFDEASAARFKQASQSLSRQVVRDLLVR